METKTQQVRTFLERGDFVSALRIVKTFRKLGPHKVTITRGWDAHTNPRFAASLGRDPDKLFDQAVAAMKSLFA